MMLLRIGDLVGVTKIEGGCWRNALRRSTDQMRRIDRSAHVLTSRVCGNWIYIEGGGEEAGGGA